VPYLPLSDETFARVVRLQLERVRARAEETYGTQLAFDQALVDSVATRARGTEIGARAVEQMIARELLPLLSRHFLERLGSKQRTTLLRVGLDEAGRFTLATTMDPAAEHEISELAGPPLVETAEMP
jgi:type VI secretion system protein VasG